MKTARTNRPFVLTTHADERLARVWPLNAAGFEIWSHDDPRLGRPMPEDTVGRFEFERPEEMIFVVVGPNAPRAKVESLAERLGLPAEHLLSFAALESRQEVAQ